MYKYINFEMFVDSSDSQLIENTILSDNQNITSFEKSTFLGSLIYLIFFIIISFVVLYLGHQILLYFYPKEKQIKEKVEIELNEYLQKKLNKV